MKEMDIVVICTNCHMMAPYTPPAGDYPFGTWDWQHPCRHCGANSWAAHDKHYDIVTGRKLPED